MDSLTKDVSYDASRKKKGKEVSENIIGHWTATKSHQRQRRKSGNSCHDCGPALQRDLDGREGANVWGP